MSNKTTIVVGLDTRDKLMWIKIQARAKNLDNVIKELIKRYKK